jgi:hypothetical protein
VALVSGETRIPQLPLYVRETRILPVGAVETDAVYNYADQVTLNVYELCEGSKYFNRGNNQYKEPELQLKLQKNDKQSRWKHRPKHPYQIRLINLTESKVSAAQLCSRWQVTRVDYPDRMKVPYLLKMTLCIVLHDKNFTTRLLFAASHPFDNFLTMSSLNFSSLTLSSIVIDSQDLSSKKTSIVSSVQWQQLRPGYP